MRDTLSDLAEAPSTDSGRSSLATTSGPWALALAALLFLAFVLWQQQRYQAYTRDFATVGDEAAHYVTGLCVRDFIVGGDWTSPMKWARNYYNHYPKVALGHWPPVFYLVQSAWTLWAGVSQTSILILQALLSVASSTLAFYVMRRYVEWPLAVLLSASFLASETSRFGYSTVGAEPLMALEFTLAALAWIRYWQAPSWRLSWLYWGAVVVTVFTKVNGLALFLVPAFCIAISWRWTLLRKLHLWVPASLAALLGVGYNVATLPLQTSGYVGRQDVAYYYRTTVDHLVWTTGVVGPLGFGFLALTVILLLRRRCRKEWYPQALAFSAVWVSSMVFHCWLVPVDEARHVLLAAPSLLIAASYGVAWLTRHRLVCRWGVAVMVALSIAYQVPAGMPPPPLGANDLASYLVSQPQWKAATMLVSSPGHGEGAFIAAMASREPRPGHVIKRATKVLATSQWNGADLRLNYNSTVDEQRALDQAHVRLLVIDEQPYERLSSMDKLPKGVAQIPLKNPDIWREVWPLPGRMSTYRVFERQGIP